MEPQEVAVMSATTPQTAKPLLALAIAFTLSTTLSACAVGPDYRPPQPVTPDSWHQLPATGVRVESPDAPSLAAWWTTLNDPQLNELIERALADNRTAKQAYARVVQARAQRAIAGSGFWPSIGASASASRTESESNFNQSGEVVSTVGESYSTGVS